MKNIKLLLLLALSIAITSCSDDDESRVYVDSEVKTPLLGTITVNQTAAAAETVVNFDYTIPQSFSVESTLEVRAVSKVSQTGEAYENIVQITIPAGQTSGSSSIEMPGVISDLLNYVGVENHTTIQMTGIALTQPDEGSILDPYTITSTPVVLNAYANNDTYMISNPSTLVMSLDWQGPYTSGNDLDLYVIDSADTVLENSESGDRFEGDYFNNPNNESYPDGDYRIRIGVWTSVDDNPIPWRIVLTHPDNSVDIYEGTVANPDAPILPVGFTKTTDASGNVTFTTYTL